MKTLLILVLFSSFISHSKGSFSFFIPHKKGPFFWKAEKEGRTIYILGTIHQGVGLKDLQCHQVISDSLSQSVLVWTEPAQKEQKLTDIAAHSLVKDPSGYSFKSLNEESQNFFKTKTNQEQFKIVEQLNYFGLSSYLTVFICRSEHKKFVEERLKLYSKQLSQKLDDQIRQLAQIKNIPQNSLDEKDSVFDLVRLQTKTASKEQVERAVRKYSQDCQQKKFADTFKTLDDLIRKYKKGESVDFLKIDEQNLKRQGATEDMIKDFRDHLQHNLLRKRNEIWLRKLLSAHAREDNTQMFVAGGVFHFQGPFNVLDKLRKNGFSVKRFNSSCKAE